MPAQPVRITTEQSGIGGWQPWLSQDAGEPRVLQGVNYDFVAAGVRSGFGTHYCAQLSEFLCNEPTNTFFELDRSILIRGGFVYELTCNGLTILLAAKKRKLKHLENCTHYQWTQAFVGETYFYAHPNYGLIYHDTFTGEWQQCDHDDLPITSDIISVADFANRLFILSSDTVSWSEIDNGLALEPDHFTTAGFQSLNLAHFSTPYAIYSTQFGIYIFTSAAIMHGRETDSNNPFNFSTHDMDLPALGPQVITKFKSNILYLHSNGLQVIGRASNNQFISELISPLMSDYLRTEKLPNFTCNCHGSLLQLRYSQSREQIFISFRESITDLFSHAYVYNINYEKWSEFNEYHETLLIMPSVTKQNSRRFGYINDLSELQQFVTNEDIKRQHANDIQSLQSSIILGPLTAANEYVDQTFRITKIAIKNANHETPIHTNAINSMLPNSERRIYTEEPCVNPPASQQRYKASAIGFIGNSDQFTTPEELILQQQQHATSYFVLNYTATHFNLQLTANEIGDYYEIASVVLTGRVAGRL